MYSGVSTGMANLSKLVQLSASDYVDVRSTCALALNVGNGYCNFSGFLVSTT